MCSAPINSVRWAWRNRTNDFDFFVLSNAQASTLKTSSFDRDFVGLWHCRLRALFTFRFIALCFWGHLTRRLSSGCKLEWAFYRTSSKSAPFCCMCQSWPDQWDRLSYHWTQPIYLDLYSRPPYNALKSPYCPNESSFPTDDTFMFLLIRPFWLIYHQWLWFPSSSLKSYFKFGEFPPTSTLLPYCR